MVKSKNSDVYLPPLRPGSLSRDMALTLCSPAGRSLNVPQPEEPKTEREKGSRENVDGLLYFNIIILQLGIRVCTHQGGTITRVLLIITC